MKQHHTAALLVGLVLAGPRPAGADPVGAAAIVQNAPPPGPDDPFLDRRREAAGTWMPGATPGLEGARGALASPDHRARLLALEVLGRSGEASDRGAVATLLASPDRTTRRAAAMALVRLVARGVLPAGEALPDPAGEPPDVADALGRFVRRELVSLCERKVRVRWSHARCYTPFVRLGRRVAPHLVAVLRDRSFGTEVRCHAMIALARSLGGGAVTPLLEMVRDLRHGTPVFRTEGEDPLRLEAAAFAALSLLGARDEAVLDEYLGAVVGDDASLSSEVRNWANWGLAVAADRVGEATRRRIERACRVQLREEGSEGVLAVISVVLRSVGSPESVPALLEALRRPRFVDYHLLGSLWELGANLPEVRAEMERQTRSENPVARGLALHLLGREPGEEGIASIRALLGGNPTELGDDEGYGAPTACQCLGLLHPPGAVADLTRELRDDADEVRFAAAVGLGLAGGQGARDALAGALGDPYEYVAFYAAEGLRRMGDPRALAGYLACLESGNDLLMRVSLGVLAGVHGGRDLGFDPAATGEERTAAAAGWRAWWEARRDTIRFDPSRGTFRSP